MALFRNFSLVCVLALICLFYKCQSEEHNHADMYKEPGKSGGSCKKEDAHGKCVEETPELPRLDGITAGYRKKVSIEPEQTYNVKTLSMSPLILEIENFLSDEECKHIIKVADDQGVKKSVNVTANLRRDQVHVNDFDSDGVLNLNEMRISLEDSFDIYLEEDDLTKMYANLLMDKNKDNLINKDELNGVKMSNFFDFLDDYLKQHPGCQSKQSKEAKIDDKEDDIIKNVQQRISKVLRLRSVAMETGFGLMVYKYEEGAHANANIDSSPVISRVPCCHTTDSKPCRECRYATVLLYLNDVEGGGETAFPVANNVTYSPYDLRNGKTRNLYKNCDQSNLVVKPEKGKALIWYTHFPDGENGGLGEVDERTWNGQCIVTKGTEWIAKAWIEATNKVVDEPTEDTES